MPSLPSRLQIALSLAITPSRPGLNTISFVGSLMRETPLAFGQWGGKRPVLPAGGQRLAFGENRDFGWKLLRSRRWRRPPRGPEFPGLLRGVLAGEAGLVNHDRSPSILG